MVETAAGADADGEATTAARGTPTVNERLSSVISCEWSTEAAEGARDN